MKDLFIETIIVLVSCIFFYTPLRLLSFAYGPFNVQTYFCIGAMAGLVAERIIKYRQLNRIQKMVEELGNKCDGCN